MRSLTTKLVLAFLGVSLVGIALVAILAGQFTERRFRNLLNAQNQRALINELGEYYRLNNGWEGIKDVTTSPAFINNFGRGFIIINVQGKIVNPDPKQSPNLRRLTAETIKNEGVPIALDGQVVGMLIPSTALLDRKLPVPELFFQFYRTLFLGALGAVAVSLILGVILARTLTRSLRELTAATHAVAQGDLRQQVPIRSQDELGELAESFNQMAIKLRETAQKQQELDMLRRDLIAWVGHDLQTPLASIRAILEALADGVIDDPNTAGRYLQTAQRNVQNLSLLIDDLFQMAQLDAGGMQLQLEPGALSDLISDTLESFNALAVRENVELRGHVDQGTVTHIRGTGSLASPTKQAAIQMRH